MSFNQLKKLKVMIRGLMYSAIFIILCSSSKVCFSQTLPPAADSSEINNLSLEDIMKYRSQGIPSALESKINSSTQIASLTSLSLRKTPGIVSIISGEEIQRSGARDLMDILKTVPGIDFGVDVQGAVGIGVRGNWANEAKILLQINGMPVNENVYGTLQFANRYPVDQISKMEIIRGPGSAIYGGEAEFAVINIITKSAAELNGVQVNKVYGRMQHGFAEDNYTIAIGKKDKDVNFSLINFFGKSNRSDKLYTDVYGNSYNMAKNSSIKPVNFIAALNYKAFTVHAFYDKMVMQTRDGFDAALSYPYKEYFTTFIADAAYEWKMSEKFMLIPKISFKQTNPWQINPTPGVDTTEANHLVYKTIADRIKFNLTSVSNLSKNINITAGLESFYDKGKKFNGSVFRNSGKAEVNYINTAIFIQSIIKNKIANITIGGRYDHNNSFGSAFVPRIGLTKRAGLFNFKLLYSNSFKAPVFENVETSLLGTIKPEKTAVAELEAGYQINKDMFITFNLYDISTHNPIVYVVDTNAVGVPDGYLNRDKGGTKGIELEYKFIGNWGYLNLGYSFYTTSHKPLIPEYSAPDDKLELLAFANHKFSLNANFNLSKSLYISPSILYYSKREGIGSADINGNYIHKEFPQTFYANFFIEHSDLFTKGFRASLGLYDIFNQGTIYIQPYSSGHAPLPGVSRELMVRLNYIFNLKTVKK